MKTVYFPSKYVVNKVKVGDFDLFKQILDNNNYTSVDFSLKEIAQMHAFAIGEALQNTNILSVSVSFNNLGPDGALAFIRAIKKTNILAVNLAGNMLGFDGVLQAFRYMVGTKIKTLFLAYNNIGPRSVSSVLSALGRHQIDIDLSHNKLW
tara:strand:+ start:31902 stop:32354 length:453 start_codon:yes stop_codon:yes gene_type:complete